MPQGNASGKIFEKRNVEKTGIMMEMWLLELLK